MAGSVPTIKTRITLDGAEDVKAKLQSIGQSGQKALEQIRAAGASVGSGGAIATQQLAKIGAQSLQAEAATTRFREALHVLHPVLAEAGLGVGNLRALSAAAGVGLGGLTAAIIGGIVVGLAKLADSSTITRQHLFALFGDAKLGDKAFAGLRKSAHDSGEAVEDVSDSYTTLFDILQRSSSIRMVTAPGHSPFVPGMPDGGLAANASLRNIVRAGVPTNDDSEKAITGLLASLKKTGGNLTYEGFAGLPQGAQRSMAQLLGTPLGRPTDYISFGESLKTAEVNVHQLIAAIAAIGPASAKAATETKENFKNAGDSALGLWHDFTDKLGGGPAGKGSQSLTVGFVEGVRENMDQDFENYDAIKKKVHAGGANIFGEKDSVLGYGISTTSLIADVLVGLRSVFAGGKAAGAAPPATFGQSDLATTFGTIGRFFGTGPAGNNTGIAPTTGAAPVPVGEAADGTRDKISNLGSAADAAKGAIDPLAQSLTAHTDAVGSAADMFAQFLKSLITPSAAPATPGGASGGFIIDNGRISIRRFAGGGHVRGPGTGTSDSIIAELSSGGHIRVSNGEYINDAATVARLGVPFFAGLKHFAAVPRFGLGGLLGGLADDLAASIAMPSLPRFAEGGAPLAAAASSASTHFGTVDFRTDAGVVRGVLARDLMKELSQKSVEARIISGGPKPRHFR